MSTATRSDEAQLWAAIGEPSRRLLLDALLTRGEATASVLAGDLPFTRQAVTKHLTVLGRAGLVESAREGREVRYVVCPEQLDAAAQEMARVASRWDVRLRSIKRLAEAAHREQQRTTENETKETQA